MYKSKYYKGYFNSLASGIRYGAKYAPIAKKLYQHYYAPRAVPARVVRSRKAYTKRRPYRRYNKKYKKKSSYKKLTQKVGKLSQQMNSNTATYIKKERAFTTAKVAAINEVIYVPYTISSKNTIEQAMDALKYFDPTTPTTLLNVDMSGPTFQSQVHVKSTWSRCRLRNNYSVPCRATIYVFKVRKDTSIQTNTAMSNSLTDMSNADITEPMIYPSDCHDLMDLWHMVKSKSAVLNPGQELEISQTFPSFQYDVSLTDSHNLTYQSYFHGSQFLIRCEGVLSHGSTSGITTSIAGVDVQIDRKYVITYPGSANIKYLEVEPDLQTITGTVQNSQLDSEQATYAL